MSKRSDVRSQDPLKSFATKYGAVVSLGGLGQQVIKVLVIPNVGHFGDMLSKDLKDGDDMHVDSEENNSARLKRQDAQKCYDAVSVTT